MDALSKLPALPRLGVGISAEFESYRRGVDALSLAEAQPGLIHFLEYGGDLARGLDDAVRAWAASGRKTTYHFLDLNLEEPEDADEAWLSDTAALAREIGAAWLCGDAGLWHFGPRDRGHQTLLPPILSEDSAKSIAEALSRVQEATGMLCLPENPPGTIYLGPLHILEYFAKISEEARSGLLLDVAHLAMFQRLRGLPPLAGLDGFPLERVVEVHVAGGTARSLEGFEYVDDSHSPEPLPDTWAILEYVLPRATNLKALVYECEMNLPAEVLGNFERLNRAFPAGAPLSAVG
jgi:uncharacterized protein